MLLEEKLTLDPKTALELLSKKEEIGSKGEGIYQQIKDKLRGKKGKFVVIHTKTGEYWIGDTPLEADRKAREKYPGEIFYLSRIGYKTAFVKR